MFYTRNPLIDYVELYFVATDGAEVHPRELVRCALRATPQRCGTDRCAQPPFARDRSLWGESCSDGATETGIGTGHVRLLDHVIVGGREHASFAYRAGRKAGFMRLRRLHLLKSIFCLFSSRYATIPIKLMNKN